MPKIFISYSREDVTFVQQLVTDLRKTGANIWFDIDCIPAGSNWSRSVQNALDSCDTLLLILSPASASSINVETEWQYFFDLKKTIIPVNWKDCNIHFQLRRLQYIDFREQINSYESAFKQLIEQLQHVGFHALKLPSSIQNVERVHTTPSNQNIERAYTTLINNYTSELHIDISLEEAYHGVSKTLEHLGKTISVKLPPGVEDGALNVISTPAEFIGLGPLYAKIHVLDHRLFRREGDDLHLDSPISIYAAIFGGTIIIPTLRGDVELLLRPGTKSGWKARLREYGMPNGKTNRYGHLYVHLFIEAPENLTQKELYLFQELQKLDQIKNSDCEQESLP